MNQVATQKPRPFSVAIASTGYRDLIQRTLNDTTRANRFVAAISSAVATNPALQECEAGSILSAALLGEALNLSPSPQLGQYYLVPYKKKDRDGGISSVTAQFQMGYKGYIQLAIRSGQYKKLNVLAIKDGELLKWDPLNEEITIDLIDDEYEREQAITIGYYAMFEYMNGFKKAIYWSKQKVESHADKYSQAFSIDAYRELQTGNIAKKDMWKYSSFWYKNFDDMALKTLIRQLISKWGIMSVDMQKAMEKDMGEISPDGSANFIDNEPQGADSASIPLPTQKPVDPRSDAIRHDADENKGTGPAAVPRSLSELEGNFATPDSLKKLKADMTFKKLNLIDACEAVGVTPPNSIEELSGDALIAVRDWVKEQ